MSLFKKNVDDTVKILKKAVSDLGKIAVTEGAKATQHKKAHVVAEAESQRAIRIRTRIQELIS